MSLPLVYASHDGHTRKIVARLAERLAALDTPAVVYDLDVAAPEADKIKKASAVIIVSPVRHGRHLPKVEKFVSKNKATLKKQNLVLVSINLTARKEDKNTPETNPYMRKWIERHKLKPALGAVFAGMLDYPRYAWWERQMIRFIMLLTGGPTDGKASVDYTPWEKVDALAKRIAKLCEK